MIMTMAWYELRNFGLILYIIFFIKVSRWNAFLRLLYAKKC